MEKNQRLNKAFELLTKGYTANRIVLTLVDQFHISHRQAYRYLQNAQRLQKPIIPVEPTIPITIKIPKNVVTKLRAYAQIHGLTIGKTVASAVAAFCIISEASHGQPP